METITINNKQYIVTKAVYEAMTIFDPIRNGSVEGTPKIQLEIDDETVFDVVMFLNTYFMMNKTPAYMIGYLKSINKKWTIKIIYDYVFFLNYLGIDLELCEVFEKQSYITDNFKNNMFDGIDKINDNDIFRRILSNSLRIVYPEQIQNVAKSIAKLNIDKDFKVHILSEFLKRNTGYDLNIVIAKYVTSKPASNYNSCIDIETKKASNGDIVRFYEKVLGKKVNYDIFLEYNSNKILEVSKVVVDNETLEIIQDTSEYYIGINLFKTLANHVIQKLCYPNTLFIKNIEK